MDITDKQRRLRRRKNKPVYIDLGAFAKDILEGDMEWFKRIAERELRKKRIAEEELQKQRILDCIRKLFEEDSRTFIDDYELHLKKKFIWRMI